MSHMYEFQNLNLVNVIRLTVTLDEYTHGTLPVFRDSPLFVIRVH